MDRLAQAKCKRSPTGAHHWWIYGSPTKLQSYCKDCGREGPQFKGVFDSTLFAQSVQHAAATRAQAKEAALHTAYDDHGRL
jgi:hypothetical protein